MRSTVPFRKLSYSCKNPERDAVVQFGRSVQEIIPTPLCPPSISTNSAMDEAILFGLQGLQGPLGCMT